MLCILVTAVFDGHLHTLLFRDLQLAPHCLESLLYAFLWLLTGRQGRKEGEGGREGGKEGEGRGIPKGGDTDFSRQ